VLRNDGTLWLNLGDSYAGSGKGAGDTKTTNKGNPSSRPMLGSAHGDSGHTSGVKPPPGLKAKDLIGIPWRVAFALQADGWYLRSRHHLAEAEPMPESVTDRPTKSHEYLFLLAKSERYYYDADAIREPLAPASVERLAQETLAQQEGSHAFRARRTDAMKAVPPRKSGNKARKFGDERDRPDSHLGASVPWEDDGTGRNRRSVWTIATQPFKGAHFATFPPALIEPCILAGSRRGDTVLDPFGGAGTTGLVADRLGRDAVLVELNPAYAEMARRRITDDAPLFGDVA
jgi:hypothetical protein